jgi:hypothetical protein
VLTTDAHFVQNEVRLSSFVKKPQISEPNKILEFLEFQYDAIFQTHHQEHLGKI